MLRFNLKSAPAAPRVEYIGDGDTGLVHIADAACTITYQEIFLDVRTALVRGYTLCPVCAARQALARPTTQSAGRRLGK